VTEIVVFGATGFTGTLIVERMRALGLPFTIAGRDAAKLHALSERLGNVPTITANAEEPRTLNALMEGTRVLVNCVGPFLRYGEPVVNAAVENGVHYLDTTGEQTYMKRILNRYDGVALRNDVTILNAMAFEYAVGDWLAALAAERLGPGGMIDSISVGYSLSGGAASKGTALSIFEMVGEQGWSYEGGRWRRRPSGWTSRALRFPHGERRVTWMPFGETLMVPRHERVQTVLTYYHLPGPLKRTLPLATRAGPLVRGALRPLVNRVVARRSAGPTPDEREQMRFTLVAEALRGAEVATASTIGSDPYGVTARIATLGAALLLAGPVQRGVRAPAHLPLSPANALKQIGVERVI
jgi:short subunit dehydrogenase-like uncharacterized protein